MNEYIGINTVREVASVTARNGVSLTSDAVKAFVERLEQEKAATEGTAAKATPATPAKAAPAKPTMARTAPQRPGLGLRK